DAARPRPGREAVRPVEPPSPLMDQRAHAAGVLPAETSEGAHSRVHEGAACDDAQVPFVPGEFRPPRELVADRFRLEPLGPQHNEDDYDAWSSSIEHIRATPGFTDGR